MRRREPTPAHEPDRAEVEELAVSLEPVVDGTRAATVADFEALQRLETLDSFRALVVQLCLFPDDAALAYDGWRRRSEVTT
jgi:hypothetical protein